LRAREHPTVSTPVAWEEVERALKKKDAGLLVFEAPQAIARFEKKGDLFEALLSLQQKLPDLKAAGAKAAEPKPIEVASQPQHDHRQGSPAREKNASKAATRKKRSEV